MFSSSDLPSDHPDYRPSNVLDHFHAIGRQRLQDELDRQEYFAALKSNDPELLSKPISLRVPAYKVSALDAVAASMSITRQDLILALVDAGIAAAITGYASGNNPNDHHVLEQENAIEHLKSIEGISDLSRSYLNSSLISFFGDHHD